MDATQSSSNGNAVQEKGTVSATVEVVELWTVLHEHYSLLGQSSKYLAYLSSYTHFIVSIIPRLQL